jgi:small subunit ribosomal protein S4
MGKFPHKEKMERREGSHLQLKGERSGSPKSALTRRSYPPGQHGPQYRRRLTPYGVQLREKQKVKRFYGVLERQFRRYFGAATEKQGDTGRLLMQELERRLDNVFFRMGFATSRRQARQIINHAHLLLNGKPHNVPSYQVCVGDVISIKESKQKSPLYAGFAERLKNMDLPVWVTADPTTFTGTVIALPEGDDILQSFDPRLIVEFYSR